MRSRGADKWRALTLALLLAGSGAAVAHEFRIAYVEVREDDADRYHVSWRAPLPLSAPPPVTLVAHPDCRLDARRQLTLERLQVRDYQLDCRAAQASGWIALRGLERVPDDALVTIVRGDGSERSVHLRGTRQRVDLAAPAAASPAAGSLFAEGVTHVLGGYDHLLYIALLFLFLRRDWRQLLVGVTVFTGAHSLTLGLAAVGWLRVPVRPVEAVIALTIAYFAVSLLRGRKPQGTAWRWQTVIALCGLVHGLGFANSLAGLGLSRETMLWGLFTFNLGIEAAQLACIGLAGGLVLASRRLKLSRDLGHAAEHGAALCAGAVGVYWYLLRLLA